jgi:hypothetical protein
MPGFAFAVPVVSGKEAHESRPDNAETVRRPPTKRSHPTSS